MDDYLLHMALRKLHVTSAPRQPIVGLAKDLSGPDAASLTFRMPYAEFTRIEEQYPEFGSEGLVGLWHLTGSTGLLKLVRAFDRRHDPNAVKAFLTDSSSHPDLVRRYNEAFETNYEQ